jgi:hypothetical protein
MGKNGLFYQLGRSGALKSIEGMKKKMIQDLSPELGDQGAEEFVNQIIQMYDKFMKDINKK